MRAVAYAATTLTLLMTSATLFHGSLQAQDVEIAVFKIDTSKYMKAFTLMQNGEPEESRELIESLLKETKVGTADYAEGLYWRGRITGLGKNAERDYRTILVDYSFSPRVPDALMQLGLLELQRGDHDAAMSRFEQVVREHAKNPLRPRANYLLAQALLDRNAFVRGCAVNTLAAREADTTDIELQNQINFQSQRCRGVKFTVADTLAKPAKGKPGAPTETKVAEAPAKPKVFFEEDPEEVKEDARLAAEAKAAKAAGGKTSGKPVATTEEKPVKPAPGKEVFVVQLGAFSNKEQANKMLARLKELGYSSARIKGTEAPFRVHVGQYPSRIEAGAALEAMRERGLDGFVTQG